MLTLRSSASSYASGGSGFLDFLTEVSTLSACRDAPRRSTARLGRLGTARLGVTGGVTV